MKNYIFVLFAALLFFTACDREDAGVQPLALEGTWKLRAVTCLCEPVQLQSKEHIWGFDQETAMITIQSKVDGDTLAYVPDSGTYSFVQNEAAKTVTIEDLVFNGGEPTAITFDYSFEDGDLILSDDPEVDGPLMRFVR